MAVASVMKQNDLRRTEGGPLKEKHCHYGGHERRIKQESHYAV